MEKKRSVGVTVFGWILIGFGCYLFLYPLIWSIVAVSKELASGIPKSASPVGSFSLLKYSGLPVILIYPLIISGLFRIILPLCSLVGGTDNLTAPE